MEMGGENFKNLQSATPLLFRAKEHAIIQHPVLIY